MSDTDTGLYYLRILLNFLDRHREIQIQERELGSTVDIDPSEHHFPQAEFDKTVEDTLKELKSRYCASSDEGNLTALRYQAEAIVRSEDFFETSDSRNSFRVYILEQYEFQFEGGDVNDNAKVLPSDVVMLRIKKGMDFCGDEITKAFGEVPPWGSTDNLIPALPDDCDGTTSYEVSRYQVKMYLDQKSPNDDDFLQDAPDTRGWLTNAQAATRYVEEMTGTVILDTAKSQISRECNANPPGIESIGEGRARRINPDSLSTFILRMRNDSLDNDAMDQNERR